MKKEIALSAAIASLFAAPMAFAQANNTGDDMQNGMNSAQSDNSMLFGMLDTDNDGTLTEKELSNMPEAVAKMAYRQMDFDGNGNVSQLEYVTAAQTQALRTFGTLDANGDGSLNTDEIMSDKAQQSAQMSQRQQAYYSQMAKKMDQDDNGKVSRSEWIQAFMAGSGMSDADKKSMKKQDQKTDSADNG